MLKFNFNLKNIKKLPKDKKQKSKKILLIIIITLVILLIILSGASLGKAIYNVGIKSQTEVAKPILLVEKDSEIIITESNNKEEYRFKVKNYNENNEVSQVDLKYYIEILNDNIDESIHYKLYKGETEIKLTDNKTDEMTFPRNLQTEEVYTLKIEYNSDENSIGDIIQNIQIKVHSEQMEA